jgi:hypothetical protein
MTYAVIVEHSGAASIFDLGPDLGAPRPPQIDLAGWPHEVWRCETREEAAWILTRIARRSVEGDGWVIVGWDRAVAVLRVRCERLAWQWHGKRVDLRTYAQEIEALRSRGVL